MFQFVVKLSRNDRTKLKNRYFMAINILRILKFKKAKKT